MRGDVYLTPRLGAILAASPPPAEWPPDGLSERELEVLHLIALGHTNSEIAGRLYLSVRTVESHRAHIQEKVRRTTRAELVEYAIDRGLLTGRGARQPSALVIRAAVATAGQRRAATALIP